MPTLIDDERELKNEIEFPDRYEVIDGNIVEMPEMSFYSAEVANAIRDQIHEYTIRTNTGRTRNDMLFHVPIPNDETLNRRPDVALISYDRWPQNRELTLRQNAGDVVPDLVVEVASPSDSGDDLLAKAEEYVLAGVRTVWVLFPQTRMALIYEKNVDPRSVRIGGQLDGGAAFPDLRIAMAGLFPPVANGS